MTRTKLILQELNSLYFLNSHERLQLFVTKSLKCNWVNWRLNRVYFKEYAKKKCLLGFILFSR